MGKVLLVEPIMRGSRLQIASYVIGALKGQGPVVLTREDYETPQFEEILSGKEFELAPKVPVEKGVWHKALNIRETLSLIRSAGSVLEKDSDIDTVFFMALDDYFLWFSILWPFFHSRGAFKGKRFVFMKYRTEFFYREPSIGVRLRLKQAIQRLMLRRIVDGGESTLLYIFDERYFDPAFADRIALRLDRVRTALVPDPFEGTFGSASKEEARKAVGLDDRSFVVLTIGKQTRRKGLDTLLKAFGRLNGTGLTLHVVGSIGDDVREECTGLMEKMPGLVRWDGFFVPEEALPLYFAASDVVALPYSRDFHATSGVLTRAAASGRPVIGPDHGILGYRIKKWGLGLTFRSGDHVDLAAKIEDLRRGGEAREEIKRDSLLFAETCTVERFRDALLGPLGTAPGGGLMTGALKEGKVAGPSGRAAKA